MKSVKFAKKTTFATLLSMTLVLPSFAQQETTQDTAQDTAQDTMQAPSESSLDALFRYAEQHNPGLRSQQELLKAEQKRVPQAYADLLPQISVQASRGKTDEDNVVGRFSETGETQEAVNASVIDFEQTKGGYDTEELRINGSWSLLDASIWTNIGQVNSEAQEAVLNYQETAQDFLAEFLNAYFNLSFARQSLDITQKELTSTQQLANLSAARYEQELGNRIDLLDARARARQLEADRLEALNQVESAQNELYEIVGKDLTASSVLADYDDTNYPELGELDAWQQIVLANNVALNNSRQAVTTAKKRLHNARAGHLPSLSLNASITEEQTDISPVSQDTDNENEQISLVLDVPIFAGGRVLFRGQENSHRLQAAQLTVDELLGELRRDLLSSYNKAKTDLERMEVLERALSAAKSSQYLHRQAQKEGLESQIDTLTAEQQLFNVERSLLRARYDYILSMIELQRLSGELDNTFVAQLDSLLIETN